MAKLTKKQENELMTVLSNMKRAYEYIENENTAVCRREKYASTILHYTRSDDSILYEVSTKSGSNIVGLQWAMGMLERFLEENSQ